MSRGVDTPICEICHGAGISQPVKEKEGEGLWRVGCAARGRDGLLGLVLTCRQMYGVVSNLEGWLALFPRRISPVFLVLPLLTRDSLSMAVLDVPSLMLSIEKVWFVVDRQLVL